MFFINFFCIFLLFGLGLVFLFVVKVFFFYGLFFINLMDGIGLFVFNKYGGRGVVFGVVMLFLLCVCFYL